jgi:cytochrome oxidase assembly protein ShyY1
VPINANGGDKQKKMIFITANLIMFFFYISTKSIGFWQRKRET